MTIKIEIDGHDGNSIVRQLRQLLSIEPKPERSSFDAPKDEPLGEPNLPMSKTSNLRQVVEHHFANGASISVAEIVEADEPELPLDQPKRKRRTKAEMEAAARAAVETTQADASELSEPSPASASQAEVDGNTASAQPVVSLPAEGAPDAAADPFGAGQSVAAPVTFDALKEMLQKLNDKGGMRDIIALLHEYGYQRIREIQPEHVEAMAVKAAELLKDAA
jgi:hypothetical protein